MKTFLKAGKEETGSAPACTGALLKIKKIKRDNVKAGASDWSKENAGFARYTTTLEVVKPKSCAGVLVRDQCVVGCDGDKEAQKKTTWEVSEGGPARVIRMLTRAGVALVGDDEDWIPDALGRTVVAPITKSADGKYTNVGLFYRESDKDCPVIGLAEGEKAKARRASADEDAEDEPGEEPEDEDADADEPDEDEDEGKKKGKKASKKASKKAAAKDEDEEEEEEKEDADAEEDEEEDDEPPAKSKKSKKAKSKKDEDDDDDDDEDDDDED